MKLRFLLGFLFFATFSIAQTGTVSGVILDKEFDNEPLPFANITIKGTTQGSSTDDQGKYSISLQPGSYTLVIAYLGYETKEIPFTLKANERKVINHTLAASGVQLNDIVIEHAVLKEKESVLLQEQQKAVEIKQAIGAQELSRKGISNAEAAVVKTSGVAKQEGVKNVFVRGLGDRYNSTSMNGLALPSEDPEYKNISLDFFGSEIIQNVSINKVFSSSLIGDVAGANIDVTSKELGKGSELEIGISAGLNTQTVNKNFYLIDGTNWFGTQKTNSNIDNLNNYTFRNNIKPNEQNNQHNTGFSISGGKKFSIGSNTFSVYLVGSFDNKYLFTEGNQRQTNNIGAVIQDFEFEKYNYNVSQLLMNNMKYKFGKGHSISLNNLLIHNNNQTYSTYFGENNPQDDGDLAYVVRQQVNDNLLFVNQLLGNFKLSDKLKYNISFAYNTVTGNEPDRRQNEYLFRNNVWSPFTDSAGQNQRFFSELKESDYVANTNLIYDFSKEDLSRVVEIGGDFRFTTRRFDAFQFNHNFLGAAPEINLENPDLLFNQSNINNGTFNILTGNGSSLEPFYYDGDRFITAGYGKFSYSFSEKFTGVVGVRGDMVDQKVVYDTNIATSNIDGPSKLNKVYILPSLAFKYNFSENSILRLNASQTYTFPQFKETAPFKYEDISFSSQGNPDLKPSDNYNFDVKYEKYFGKSELISVTGFGKFISNTITRSEVPSAGNVLTYLNSGDATVFGAELEVRKNIFNNPEEDNNSLSFGLNASYLISDLKFYDNTNVQFTGTSSEMEGATPLLVNTDLTLYNKINNSKLTSTVVFNYFSDRVYSIGTLEAKNTIEKAVPTLDFVSKLVLNENYSIGLKANNLLNPYHRLVREGANGGPEVTLKEYKRGYFVSLSFGYTF